MIKKSAGTRVLQTMQVDIPFNLRTFHLYCDVISNGMLWLDKKNKKRTHNQYHADIITKVAFDKTLKIMRIFYGDGVFLGIIFPKKPWDKSWGFLNHKIHACRMCLGL